ncbi:hypothetical protein EHS25_009047 [Saitozyma podzolica]|uniref:Uncharacterized protein n=1 Tax=Saitozyma podzolica TaxID=1890683 RepID=A0A427YKP7_9TREE|nr:hypothetical protein EHS25_009047 [Saitozyma podzolica]
MSTFEPRESLRRSPSRNLLIPQRLHTPLRSIPSTGFPPTPSIRSTRNVATPAPRLAFNPPTLDTSLDHRVHARSEGHAEPFPGGFARGMGQEGVGYVPRSEGCRSALLPGRHQPPHPRASADAAVSTSLLRELYHPAYLTALRGASTDAFPHDSPLDTGSDGGGDATVQAQSVFARRGRETAVFDRWIAVRVGSELRQVESSLSEEGEAEEDVIKRLQP